jgi:hypothetical protein
VYEGIVGLISKRGTLSIKRQKALETDVFKAFFNLIGHHSPQLPF